MSSYCHKRNFTVRYSDVDFHDRLKPSAMLAFAQETSGSSADELGFGYDDLIPFGYGFIIVATCCEIYKTARPKDVVTVETWPLTPRHVIFERDYNFRDKNGGLIASMATRWCLIDLTSGMLLTPDKLSAHAACPYRDEHTLTSPAWKIPKLGDEGREAYRLTVKSSQLDHYFHVNNTKYADFFLDCFTAEEQRRTVKSFRISYTKQVKEGEELEFFRKDGEEESIFEARVGGVTTTQFAVRFTGEKA